MALDFRNRLPDAVTQDPLYQHLYNYLLSKYAKHVDIEHVLWELGALSITLEALTSRERFLSGLLRTNRLDEFVLPRTSGTTVHDQFSKLTVLARSLQNKINEQVYELYATEPDSAELNRSWIPLLKRVSSAGFERVDIVTTNYDLVIESALEMVADIDIELGHASSRLLPGIDLDRWRTESPERGMLTKLHGSVDWKLGAGSTAAKPVIRRGHPEFDGNHEKRSILYPGFKDVPSSEPFITFHEYFERRLRDSSRVLFIGFAFRDEYINGVIDRALSKDCKIAIVNPDPKLPNLRFLQNVLHLPQGFGVEKNSTLLAGAGIAPFDITALDEWLV